MAFIRVKRFKRKDGSKVEYAYIVQNRRYKRKKKVKQKFKNYLGKVYRFNKVNTLDFFQFYAIDDVAKYIKNRTKEQIFSDILKWELLNHGFKDENGLLKRGNCFFNIDERRIYNEKDKNIALAINDGLFCNYTIRRISTLKVTFSEDEAGYKLAKYFVEAGLKVPKDIFVGYFEKLM